ncbi:MAG: GAF and ANTAR domain-containing protein [Actinomycetota bacterium]|nr:GAF and ANTAR domain-containing protein [Actinomycetota bacterium]
MHSESLRDQSLQELAALFSEVGQELFGLERVEDTLDAVTELAVRRIEGAQLASITRARADRFETVASTDERAKRADSIQYELRSGPCVDAIVDQTVYRTGDLAQDQRWPVFGARAATEVGLASMLSFRLGAGVEGLIAGLNVYSSEGHAFDDVSESIGTVLATHSALAVSAATTREAVANLQRALESNREIGTAMGILMARLKIPREQAFGLLRMASQATNRKLRDIATDVVDTGVLDLPPAKPRRNHPARPGRT